MNFRPKILLLVRDGIVAPHLRGNFILRVQAAPCLCSLSLLFGLQIFYYLCPPIFTVNLYKPILISMLLEFLMMNSPTLEDIS